MREFTFSKNIKFPIRFFHKSSLPQNSFVDVTARLGNNNSRNFCRTKIVTFSNCVKYRVQWIRFLNSLLPFLHSSKRDGEEILYCIYKSAEISGRSGRNIRWGGQFCRRRGHFYLVASCSRIKDCLHSSRNFITSNRHVNRYEGRESSERAYSFALDTKWRNDGQATGRITRMTLNHKRISARFPQTLLLLSVILCESSLCQATTPLLWFVTCTHDPHLPILLELSRGGKSERGWFERRDKRSKFIWQSEAERGN